MHCLCTVLDVSARQWFRSMGRGKALRYLSHDPTGTLAFMPDWILLHTFRHRPRAVAAVVTPRRVRAVVVLRSILERGVARGCKPPQGMLAGGGAEPVSMAPGKLGGRPPDF